MMRRRRGVAAAAAALFLLANLRWPDALWALPAAVAAALLFAQELSVFAPLSLVAGVFFGSELPAAYLRPGGALSGATGRVLALALLVGAAFLTALELTREKGFDAGTLHYAAGSARAYRWRPAGGTVLVIFSLNRGGGPGARFPAGLTRLPEDLGRLGQRLRRPVHHPLPHQQVVGQEGGQGENRDAGPGQGSQKT